MSKPVPAPSDEQIKGYPDWLATCPPCADPRNIGNHSFACGVLIELLVEACTIIDASRRPDSTTIGRTIKANGFFQRFQKVGATEGGGR